MDALRSLDPRRSPGPLVLAVLGGMLAHAIDQSTAFRAGPVPILLTAPTVAVLAYLYGRPDTSARRLAALAAWGFLGSALAVLGVTVHALTYQLPRPMTGPEMLLYDLGLFCWFVASLTAAYTVAARRADRDRHATLAVVIGPPLQFAWVFVVVLLVEAGVYA